MWHNSREKHDSESVYYEIRQYNRQKMFAVAIMGEVWAGAKLPWSLIREAVHIKRQMVKDGTWKPA